MPKVKLDYSLTGSVVVEMSKATLAKLHDQDFPMDQDTMEELTGEPIDSVALVDGLHKTEFNDADLATPPRPKPKATRGKPRRSS